MAWYGRIQATKEEAPLLGNRYYYLSFRYTHKKQAEAWVNHMLTRNYVPATGSVHKTYKKPELYYCKTCNTTLNEKHNH